MVIQSPSPRLPQGSSGKTAFMQQFAFTQLQVFRIFTSILKGKWVLRAHLPQNQPAAEGRAAGPGFPKQLPKGMLLLSP